MFLNYHLSLSLGEFLGATSSYRLDFTPPVKEARVPSLTPESSSPSQVVVSTSSVASDVTPSVQRQRQLPHPDRESSGLRHHQSHAAIARCRRGLSETLRGQSTGDIPRGATLTAWRDRQRGCSSRPPSVWAQLRQRQIHTLQ